jgi:hypothetical protein
MENCKTKAEINTKKRKKELGMTSRQRGMGEVGKLLLKGGPKRNKGRVTLCGLVIYIKKYLKCERRVIKTQIFHHAKI